MKPARLYAALLLALASTSLFAQVTPPPRPAGSGASSGPTLEATMKFIIDRISDFGTVSYVVFARDTTNGSTWSNSNSYTVTNVHTDATSCYVGYHGKGVRDSQIVSDQDSGFYLKDVLDVVIEPEPQFFTEQSASGGNPNVVTTSTNPTLTALLVRRPHNVVNSFPILDPSLADRLAKAITHAVELCGGGNKEPF
ncbi:MAG: hypothetical protein WCA89_06270 [Terracidiphilus sp.]|jgi:hypothetical protein